MLFLYKLLFFSQVALIVAQSRDRKNRLSGILLTSLSQGLQRVAVAAKKMKGNKLNRPFPSCLKPLFQIEAKCRALDMKILFLFSCE